MFGLSGLEETWSPLLGVYQVRLNMPGRGELEEGGSAGVEGKDSDLWGGSGGAVCMEAIWAVREINNKTDGVADGLLPGHELRLAFRDSKCDPASSLREALHLLDDAFDGAGVHAIVGAGCSGASAYASRVAASAGTPLVSPTSSSPELSDGVDHPYFARVIPSDEFTAVALVDLLRNLWNYTRVALVHATESYGTGAANAFLESAFAAGLDVGTVLGFATEAEEFNSQLHTLSGTRLRVIVLLCQTNDAARFLRQAYLAGVGGVGYLWLGGDAFASVATSSEWRGDAADTALREAALRGAFAITPDAATSPRLVAFAARAAALRPTTSGSGGCDLETDDDGNYLWAQDVDGNASTPLRCAGREPRTLDAFAYDAVFAVALGMHELLYVQNRSEVVGEELRDALLTRVAFDGVTGPIDFHDSSKHHGDRRTGFVYTVLNFAADAEPVAVGAWAPCGGGGGACGWGERWSPTGAPLTYSTGTADPPPQAEPEPTDVAEVRLGVLLPVIGRTASDRRGWWPRMGWHQAVAEVNDKADGVADNLLPRTRLVLTTSDSKCDSTAALRGTLSLLSSAFDGKGVLLGAGCSAASARAAEVASVLQLPIISPTSTSPELEVHPFFFRVIASDTLRYSAVADILRRLFNYSTVALVSSTDAFGEGGARAFVTAAQARSIDVAAHVPVYEGERQVVSALRASGCRVVVLICHEDDAAELLVDAWRGGVGGEGYLWFGASWSASLWENHATLAAEVPTRDAVLRGSFAIHAGHTASATHASYAARQAALRPTTGNADRCDNARDDDGILFWATDDDRDPSTPLVCTGYDPRQPSMYDEYAYDAVLAIAHALHELLYVQGKGKENRSEVVGEELREALLTRVAFDGATGAVAFSPRGARADPAPPFFLTNYAGTPAGLVHVGTYASCAGRCSWRERWTSTGAALTFASATGRPPAERAAGGGPAATVRLGVLLPMFVWREGGHTPILGSLRHAVFQAIREINNKSDGVADGLLPHTRLVFSYSDSKCDSTHGLTGALALREGAFDGAGVNAIIGAFCSGASATAARVAGATALPIVSPASTSPELSDGRAFPFFLRVAPSDALLASGMADLLLHLWGYRTVALVHSNDPYGIGGADAFLSAALVVGLTVPSFAARATHFVPQQRALRQSGARVVVLFCQSSDGARVLRHALAAGVGGEGYLWLCGDTLATLAMWEDDDQLAASAALREAALRGTFAIAPLAGDASPRLAAFYSRAVAARAAAAAGGSGGGCDLETDDDGNYLWAQDVDDNASTPLRCAGREPEAGNHTFDAFAYDAVFAVAHGVHELLYVQNRSEVVGGELLDALLTRVAFDGATGRVAFHDASDDANLWGHGDRRAGVAYAVLNFASAAAGLVAVGTWAPCASGEGACDWGERWSPTGAPLTYSTGTDPPTQRAGGGWCLANEALTSTGECACADGYERSEEGGTAAECVPCAQLTYSLAGVTEGCTLCAAGAYRPAADLPASECAPCAELDGAVCGLNATLATLALAHGHWRASPAAVAVVRCEARGGWSPCRGGDGGGGAVEEREGEQQAVGGEDDVNSAWADGYCTEGHWGPRCELCGSRRAGATYDEYFDAWDAHCRSCDGVPARAAALAGVLLLLAAAAAGLASLAARGGGGSVGAGEGGGSYASAAVARARRVEAVWRRAALRPKLKAAVGLCQCLSAVQKVYDVAAPDGVGGWTRWLQRAVDLARDAGAGALLPAACYGTYRRRLLIFALWPLALLVLLAAGGLAASGGWRRAKGGLRGGAVRCALPPLLVITFLLVPSTSTHIFLTFLCDEVEPRPDAPPLRYLHDDLALSCDSEEYTATRRTALALIAVWPVGVPLLYCALLRAAAPHATAASGRRRRRAATPLLRAVAFLTEDYAPSRFWWEPLEMCRKLVLTGWVLLIPEKSEQARVLVALLVSILFLSLHLAAKPHRRPEDGVLMTIVHLTLILVYLCVLVIKTCNASSAACSSFGFGATADGVFTFFLLFGLAMVTFMLAVGAGNLWIESCVPKVILLARAHSVSPSTIMRRVLARRWVDFLRRVRRALRVDTAALTPRFAMSVHRVRAARGRRPLPHAPEDVAPFVRGELMDLSIDGILPRTRCFVHVDLDAFALRWSSDCFLSLHAVTEVRPAPAADHLGRHRSPERPFPRARRLSHLMCRAASSSSAAAAASSSAAATATAAAPVFFSLPSSRQSGAATLPPPSSSPTTTTTLVVAFLDASGATAALRLHFESAAKAEAWRGGLLRARTLPPRHAHDAHTRWALACLAASRGGGGGGEGGGGGGRAALRALLTCANASPKLALADLDAALHAAARDEAAMASLWGEGGGDGEAWGRGRRPPPARVVAALLLRLSLSTAALRELFCRHAANSAIMHADEWREFVSAEQRSHADADAKADADADADTYAHAYAGTHAHAEDAEDADFVQFALRLMDRRNDAVAPRRGACGDEGSGGDQHPLAHYWCACSHNSYIVGDQLTGRSTADAYRRQLLQGCRHLEIDCWDGSKSLPVVTHGGTFCTVEQFDEVARAIAECAFVTSELPVMLSLEMHCTPPQQRRLATMCVLHFGRKLLSHDELVASGHATLLSPADLRRRILLKGKVAPPRDTFASAVAPSNEKTTRRRAARARISLRLSAPWQWKHGKAQVGQLSAVRVTSECASPTRWTRQSNRQHVDVDVAAAADEASSQRTTHTAPISRPKGTDEFYESKLALRKSALSSLLSEWPSANGWIISVSERRHLALLGLTPPERDQIERTAHGGGKGMGMAWGVRVGPAEDSAAEEEEGWGGRGGGGAATTLVRLACDPPPEVGRVQRATAAGWLVRCYPMGLRFSGNNMSPLPCWLSGVGHVALNMSNNDLPVQLHFALFAGTGGYVLKPHGMRKTQPHPSQHSAHSPCHPTCDADEYWPPARETVACATIEILSLHNLPKRGEHRPQYSGRSGVCHQFVPELSGKSSPPDLREPSSPAVTLSLHPIGGFCAVSSKPVVQCRVHTELSTAAVKRNGLCAEFGETFWCFAAEPDATLLHVGVSDEGEAAAYETAVLGRLRRGYRVFRLRSSLGTRIELCCLFVRIEWSTQPNLWSTPRQLRLQQSSRHSSKSAKAADDSRATPAAERRDTA
ncbi:hypothetical protein AB1Y20_008897 [Prymnesium parvum]|uniref:PI-PLC Y-box domain-containing protein n=1 Tax=Prymnesium parvum TaxID=97485 RepID=A0AB34K2Z6_PRYPA